MNEKSSEVTLGVIAHVLGLLTGFVGPLVMYFVHNKRDLGRDQIVEALNFQLTILIAALISMVLMLVFIGFILIIVVVIADFILCIVAAVEASKGSKYRYPVAIRFLKP